MFLFLLESGGLPRGLLYNLGFQMGPGAQARQREYDSTMLLLDVSEDGSVAQISFPTRAFVISTQILCLWVRLRTIHIIDYGVNNLFQFDYMIQHSIVSKYYIVFYNFKQFYTYFLIFFISPLFKFNLHFNQHFAGSLKNAQLLFYCFDILTMKLWSIPTLFKYVSDSWAKLISSYANKSKPLQIPSPKQEIKIAKTSISTQRHRKFSKFNINEYSDSSDGSKINSFKKNKKIQKKSKQNIKLNQNEKIQLQAQQIKTNRRFTDDQGQQISSIGARDSQDSQNTIIQFLVSMEPSKATQFHPFQIPISEIRTRAKKQRMLVKQLFKTSKNKDDDDKTPNMKKHEKKIVPLYQTIKITPTQAHQVRFKQRI